MIFISNGKAMIVLLTQLPCKWVQYKWANIFPNQNPQEEKWKLN